MIPGIPEQCPEKYGMGSQGLVSRGLWVWAPFPWGGLTISQRQ